MLLQLVRPCAAQVLDWLEQVCMRRGSRAAWADTTCGAVWQGRQCVQCRYCSGQTMPHTGPILATLGSVGLDDFDTFAIFSTFYNQRFFLF